MNNYDLISYLYFLKRNDNNLSSFSNEFFHFYRYVCLSSDLKWQKLFVFEDYQVNDCDFDSILSTLLFHGLISENYQITDDGYSFLNEQLKTSHLSNFFEEFLLQYHGESATSNSCFSNQAFFTASCYFCHEKSCLNNKSKIIDFLPLALRKRKNPYKSVTF